MKKNILTKIALSALFVVSFSQVHAQTSDCVMLSGYLTRGTTSQQVTLLQNFLYDAGFFNQEPTGYFGPITELAVKAYQTSKGIEQTGTVGPITRQSIASNCPAGTTTQSLSADAAYKQALQSSTITVPTNTSGSDPWAQYRTGIFFEGLANVPQVTPTFSSPGTPTGSTPTPTQTPTTPTYGSVNVTMSADGVATTPQVKQTNQSIVLAWSVTGSTSGTSCTGSGALGSDANIWNGSRALSGQVTVRPTQSTGYELTCKNASGQILAIRDIYIVVSETPVADPTKFAATLRVKEGSFDVIYEGSKAITVGLGADITIAWLTTFPLYTPWPETGAEVCVGSGGTGEDANTWNGKRIVSGKLTIKPTQTTTYTITCTNPYSGAVATDSVTVTIDTTKPATTYRSVILTADGQRGKILAPVEKRDYTLAWNVTGASASALCTANEVPYGRPSYVTFTGTVQKTGSVTERPEGGRTIYYVTCNDGGFVFSDNVEIIRPPTRLSVIMTTPDGINYEYKRDSQGTIYTEITARAGNNIKLNWTTWPVTFDSDGNVFYRPAGDTKTFSQYVSCVGSGASSGTWNGAKDSSGTATVQPTQSTTYTITCSTPASLYGTDVGETAKTYIKVIPIP